MRMENKVQEDNSANFLRNGAMHKILFFLELRFGSRCLKCV